MTWSFQQLLSFQIVARLGNMTEASHELGYTTGAISQQIANLESTFGAKLFTRLPRGLILTDNGEIFLHEANNIIDAYRRIQASFEQISPSHSITLRLGIFTSAAVAYLPRVLESLKKTHPHINVLTREVDIDSGQSALVNGLIDACLTVNYPNIPMPKNYEVSTDVLLSEPFLILSEKTSAGRHKKLDLKEENWILPTEDSFFGKSVRQALHKLSITPKVTHTLNNHVAAIALSQAGLGLTVATNTTADLSKLETHQHPFPGSPFRQIEYQTLKGSASRPSLIALKNTLSSVIA